MAECGACTVHIDGQATRSCVYPLSAVGTAKVVTLEGLGTPEHPHPLQTAFVEEQAAQCGYCINGMIMQSASFLEQNPHPTEHEVNDHFLAVPPAACSPGWQRIRWLIAEDPISLIHIVLSGSTMPATQGAPMAAVMPGFAGSLNDGQVADVRTYIRSSWGNKGGPVDASQVTSLSAAITAPQAKTAQ